MLAEAPPFLREDRREPGSVPVLVGGEHPRDPVEGERRPQLLLRMVTQHVFCDRAVRGDDKSRRDRRDTVGDADRLVRIHEGGEGETILLDKATCDVSRLRVDREHDESRCAVCKGLDVLEGALTRSAPRCPEVD